MRINDKVIMNWEADFSKPQGLIRVLTNTCEKQIYIPMKNKTKFLPPPRIFRRMNYTNATKNKGKNDTNPWLIIMTKNGHS